MPIFVCKRAFAQYKPLNRLNYGSRLQSSIASPRLLLDKFVKSYHEIESYRKGKPIVLDGHNLSVAAITAAARYGVPVTLDTNSDLKDGVLQGRRVIEDKVKSRTSVYGLSTGFGGTSDTRTNKPLLLGNALLQTLQSGVLPSQTKNSENVLPLLDPLSSSSMPESWVRAAMVIRMNDLIRGHSGVRWVLIEKIKEVLDANIVPLVPLRGSISASGDLAPLSYIGGAIIGDPNIRVFVGPTGLGVRKIVGAAEALKAHGIVPLPLAAREHLGLVNGTAFSSAVASLAMDDAIQLALLVQVCSAMGTEALLGTRASHDPFIHDIARPHPGQIEVAKNIWDLLEGSVFAKTDEKEVTIEEDRGTLKQDRYPLRTAPQYLGPQNEDLLVALRTITLECNSSTDNPLVSGSTGVIHQNGNFQAMSVTNSVERTRVALFHFAKLIFAQCTELLNPAMNRGLPPNAAIAEPSLDYHAKGLDIALASYVAEMGWMANPVSTFIQSAENHNQAVNSLALVSARKTVESLDILSNAVASYLYVLCQALDIRALQKDFYKSIHSILDEEIQRTFTSAPHSLSSSELYMLHERTYEAFLDAFDKTSSMDVALRMDKVAATCSPVLIETLGLLGKGNVPISDLRKLWGRVGGRTAERLEELRKEYLGVTNDAGTEVSAAKYLHGTKGMYDFIRKDLGIEISGKDNLTEFQERHNGDGGQIGRSVSIIKEAIADGRMKKVIVGLLDKS